VNNIFYSLSEQEIMGLTICREAGGEPVPEGQIAIGTVILERVDHRLWDGTNIQQVCLRKYQFSCYNEFDRGYGKTLHMAEAWDACMATDFSLMNCYSIAVGMLSGRIPRHPILSAVHCCQYLNPKLAGETRERWLAAGMKPILVIGNHEFFAE